MNIVLASTLLRMEAIAPVFTQAPVMPNCSALTLSAPLTSTAFNLISNNDTRTLSWTVGPPSLLTEAGGRGNVFWINVYQNSPPYINLNSRAFNVTNTTASSSSSTSVAAAPTSNTAHPSSQGPIATVTISATETVTMSPQPTLPVGNGRNNSVGLGVGLGLGVPFAVLLGIAIYHYYFGNSSHRRGRVVAESGFAPNAASGGDEKEIVAVTEAYREVLPPAPAELVGTVQRHELDGKGMYHVYPGT
ncbi:hypothetical protein K432DRAFT_381664 [Lepidopterella palustris CBS 459.81]|uniref:Mid2 domain-containing protein n=1 Tax=Lepidopterella palustris CBS 459.81 TaxID=1314670 RepID=A0A8E2JGG6_9PEZI|nr:hypothetical protein K432DRAFT_381664 [Lepidopterella palustris CBS 459.81]